MRRKFRVRLIVFSGQRFGSAGVQTRDLFGPRSRQAIAWQPLTGAHEARSRTATHSVSTGPPWAIFTRTRASNGLKLPLETESRDAPRLEHGAVRSTRRLRR